MCIKLLEITVFIHQTTLTCGDFVPETPYLVLCPWTSTVANIYSGSQAPTSLPSKSWHVLQEFLYRYISIYIYTYIHPYMYTYLNT